MKITVLGCGALGQVWLSALSRQGHDVQGWLRIAQPYCLVNVMEENGSVTNQTLTANDPQFLAESQLLLVTLKAWQVSPALKSLQTRMAADCPVLLLHNGMGTLDELQNLPQPVLLGTTTHAARRDGNVILHVASGITHIGPASQDGMACSPVADMLHQALPVVAWHDNIAAACWRKLAVNCVINPLTAISDCANGQLAGQRTMITQLCEEVAEVMTREGLHTTPGDLVDYVLDVIHSTADNISSMLQDVRAGRRTEIDYINGYLLRCARAHGISVPANNRLYDEIKRKESDYARQRLSSALPGTWQ